MLLICVHLILCEIWTIVKSICRTGILQVNEIDNVVMLTLLKELVLHVFY